ncbi:MAG: ATPase, T2SS/T4P/T4SS family [Solirubrobacteraceae bacterium]
MNPAAPPTDRPGQIQRPGVTPPTRRGGSGRTLDDVIVELGFVAGDEMEGAVVAAARSGSSADKVLLLEGKLTEEQISRAVAERFGLDHLDLSMYRFDPNAAKLVTPAAVKRYKALPVSFVNDRTLLVAMSDPGNVLAVDDIAVMTGYEVRPAVAASPDIERALVRLAELGEGGAIVEEIQEAPSEALPPPPGGPGSAPAGPLYDLSELQTRRGGGEEDASVIGLVHRVISEAVDRGASDIHWEPFEEEMKIRYRVDGILIEAARIPAKITPTIVSRIKILSDLDIAERRLPQDGRVTMELEKRPRIDLRVVTLPCQYGESVIMRILDSSNAQIELDMLGMLPQARERFTHSFTQAHGAVLVTGPTGSGKSTSLYAALNQVNTPEKNIITIEDPVEYQMYGIKQIQVNNKTGLTFATGLRAMMRADPDIIMVGEIRDKETAQIAVEASLTGHLVLSTLHTNDAPTAITRLTEMGIEPFLVGSSLDAVVAQRLARRLCDECKRRVMLPAEVLRQNGFNVGLDLECYEPVGCARCGGTGYKGRIGLYEVMTISETIRNMAVARETADAIAHEAVREGMMRLREDGLEKVRRGVTSIAEIARVAGSK